MSELFPTENLRGEPPRLAQLRAKYEAAKDALAEANDWEDEHGDPIPQRFRREFERARLDLRMEEERLSKR
jgi:hypothetical protein